MAFTYKEIRKQIRFKEGDNNEIRFSDYDIKMAVNEVIRYLTNALAANNADFNEKIKVYDEEEINAELLEELTNDDGEIDESYTPISFKIDGIEFPEDYIALVSVKGKLHDPTPLNPCLAQNIPMPWEYKVLGDKIYCGCKRFELVYKASIAEVKEEEDTIELPYMFKDNFVQLARMILNQAENDIMRDAVDSAVQQLIPKRRYRNAEIRMPFKIGYRW